MKSEHEKRLQRIFHQISEATEPGQMNTREALDFLENLVSRLEGFIDGLRDDLINGDIE